MKTRQWVLFGAYVAVIVVLAFHHEMWRDEVRALSVAIDAPSWGAMFSDLHHEGHPGLWYVILRSGYAMTHSNLVLPVAALLIAAAAAWLILWYAPFPLWTRALALFGAFLGYELSVSARNYGIGVLLLVGACILFPSRAKRPLVLGFVLALLANTSIHAAIATAIILALWLADTLHATRRKDVVAAASISGIVIVIAGIIVAILIARPSPDMVWGSTLGSLSLPKILGSVFVDPGKGLRGYLGTNIAAANEFPWRLAGIDPVVASRIIVDIMLAWLLWKMRSSWKAIAAIVLSVVSFEAVFRNLYTGGARHEGLLLFLIVAVCWIVASEGGERIRKAAAAGLLPLLACQALALPVLVHRIVKYNESSSRPFAEFIAANPRYRDAILVGEPDYFMEPMRYYVKNRIYMARQRELSDRVYFDKGARRANAVTLSDLQAAAEEVSCRYRSPVLLAIGDREFRERSAGSASVAYRARFSWTAEESARFRAAWKRVADFPRATTDEGYEVFEAPPCMTSGK